MWRRVLEAAGVDAGQWLALVRTGLRLDFRRPSLDTSRSGRAAGSAGRALFSLLILYGASGTSFAIVALFVPDRLVAGTIVLSAVMFMVAATILIEFHTVVVSPDDFAILGYMPIASRTYFAARLANLLFYVLVLTTVLGLPSMAAFCVEVRVGTAAIGVAPFVGLSAACAVYFAATTVAFAMVGLYAGLLRVISPARLRRALTYLQIALGMAVYGSFLLLPQLMSRQALAGLKVARSPWLYVDPASWFASYLEIAAGRAGAAEAAASVASLALLVGLGLFAFRFLALDYSERLAALATSVETARTSRAPTRKAWLFRSGEARVVALLIRNQFKQDMKFRLAVLSIFPLTLFYFLYGLRGGPMPDPFVGSDRGSGQWFMLHFAMLSFPMMLLPNLSRSDAFRASWIFHASPASKGRLILSMKNFVLTYFLLPYLALVATLMAFYFTSPLHVAIHVTIIGLIGNITLLVAIRLLPHLPFSRPIQRGEQSARYLTLFLVTSAIAGLLLPLLTAFVYRTPLRAALTVAALAAAGLLLERLLRMNIDRLTATLEFAG